MSLKHGLLGLLNYGKMTGYELNKVFKDSLSFFWQAQASQIYRELNAMERLGWLTSEMVFQTDKPNKRQYSITETGRSELLNWLKEKNLEGESQVRSEFLMKLFFSAEKSIDENIDMLKNFRTTCAGALASLDEIDDAIERYRPNPDIGKRPLYWGITASFGKSYWKMCLDWADQAIRVLEDSR